MKATFAVAAVTLALSAATYAQMKNPIVGGQEMFPTRNIIQNAMNSADHTTLVAAVKAAGLVETLEGTGPFTVFAPTNAAFDKLPAGTVQNLLKPEMKGHLTDVLTYHVVAGKWSSKDLAKKIKDGKGSAMLKTVQGGTLTAMMKGSCERRDSRHRHSGDAEVVGVGGRRSGTNIHDPRPLTTDH
jgi:uncharacterized surface protein with fasciclin (FAS1) repeats